MHDSPTAMKETSSHDQSDQREKHEKRESTTNLRTRIITGLVLLPVIMFVTLFGSWLFALVIALIVWLAALEFYHLERGQGQRGNAITGVATAMAVLLAFYLEQAWIWQVALAANVLVTGVVERFLRGAGWRATGMRILTTLGGVLYIAFPAAFLIAIRGIHPFGLNWLFVVLFATWGADTAAYLAGQAFGHTPLAPRLSPKKTVEGAIGGIVGGIFFPALVLLQIEALTLVNFLALCVAPFFAIAGDLFESALKRWSHVKDSGMPGMNIFPGHGGVLDRIDALLWVSTWFYIFLALRGLVWF